MTLGRYITDFVEHKGLGDVLGNLRRIAGISRAATLRKIP